MKRRRESGIVSVGIAALLLTVVASADTLVMKDGRRVDGQLIAVRDGIIEFEGQRGFLGRERLRIDRLDVRRIEFDDVDGSRFGAGDRRDRNPRGDPAGSRPTGLRERDVSVEARTQWNDTGIDVRAGQAVYFAAAGRVRWGPGRQDGAEGERNSPYNAHRPIPNRPGAALIGRVGDSTDYFFIGAEQGAIRMRASGRLQLGINDDYLLDNTGSLRVTVFY